MGKRKRTRKRTGHWCWCCGRTRPNEKFSGRGHERHLCRDCKALGSEELAYRQGVRDVDRLLYSRHYRRRTIRKRAHEQLQRMRTSHPNPRVRAYIEQIFADDAAERRDMRAWALPEIEGLLEYDDDEDWEELRDGACDQPTSDELDEQPFERAPSDPPQT